MRPKYPINYNDYPTKMLDLKKLADHYNVGELYVLYDWQAEPQYLKIPLHQNLFVMMKTYLLHDTRDDTIVQSKNLIGGGNYWIKQFIDDHKNKRINVRDYYV